MVLLQTLGSYFGVLIEGSYYLGSILGTSLALWRLDDQLEQEGQLLYAGRLQLQPTGPMPLGSYGDLSTATKPSDCCRVGTTWVAV